MEEKVGTSRGSDAEMDRLLHAALEPDGGEAAARVDSDCPSAGEIAAFVDATLADDERGTMEVHLADCSRCQEVLAAMATAPPQVEDARAALTSDLGLRTSDGRWHLSVWGRWALPATAAITMAVVLYVLVPMEHAPTIPDTARTQTASRISAEQPPAGGTADGTTAAQETAKSEGSPAPGKPKRAGRAAPQSTRPAAPPADIAAVQPVPAPSEVRPADAPAAAGRGAGGGGIAGGVAGSGNAMVAAAPPPPLPELKPRPTEPAAAQPSPTRTLILAAQKPAAPSSDADKAKADKAGVVSESVQIVPASPLMQQTKAAGFTAPAKIVVTANGQVRWRFVPGGQILRSSNAGASWHLLPATPPAAVLAASAPSPTICWAVGRNGVVLVTADGETWAARSFTEPVDLVGVEGRDALTATVTTRDGRVFTTRDGGLSWTAGK